MRKMKFFSVSAALFAVGMLVTSCWTSDDPVSGGGSGSGSSESPKTTVVTDIDGAKYSVKATSNLPAKYTISSSDEVINGTSATFDDIEASSVTVTVEYTGSKTVVNKTQKATVNFSKETTSASLNFVFVELSESVPQAAAKSGTPVKNTDTSVTEASIEVPSTLGDIGTTEDFSITVYKLPANVVTTGDIKKDNEFKIGGYVLHCEPDGATFGSNPVTLKVFVGTALAGKTLSIENGSGSETVPGTVASDGYASFAVSHFSDWILKLPLKTLSEPTSFSDLIPPIQTINAVSGENKFSYTKKIGFDVDLVQGNAKAFQFVCDVLQSIYGDFSSSLTEEASFTVDGAGVANVSVFQNKSQVEMSDLDGMFTFNVTYYDHVEYKISVSGTTHSGGSGK